LASGRQLWRLNTLGRLRLADAEADPISSQEARVLIGAEFERLGWSTPRGASESGSGSEDSVSYWVEGD
jgi:hypothetical protein